MTVSAIETFLTSLGRSGLLTELQLIDLRNEIVQAPGDVPVQEFAAQLVQRKLLTRWQAGMLMAGHTAFFLGKYKLLSELGRGGMGVVLKAEQASLGRIVALKVMARQLVHDQQAVARFRREIQTAAALTHPNVVTAIDADHVQDTHFLVMEYVDGEGLDAILNRNERLPAAIACEYIRQAALGLQHALEMGLAHRDIKPSNLLVTYNPDRRAVVKILDMGLACFTTAIRQEGELTATGQILGTPDYISPEQARDTKSADIRSDIYSLGCTLFRAVTGRLPFEGQNMIEKLMARSLSEAPPLRQYLPDASPELESVVARMLARDPSRRYQTPSDVARALEPFSGDTASAAHFVSASAAASPPSRAGKPVTPVKVISAQVDPALNQFLQDLAHDDRLDRLLRRGESPISGQYPHRKWLAGAGALVLGILVIPLVWQLRGDKPRTEASAPGDEKKPIEPELLTANRADLEESRRLQEEERLAEERRLAEAYRLVEEEEAAKRREADAEQALPQFAARAAEPQITFVELACETQAFKAKHGGTLAAVTAAEMLMKLRSPLDRLDPQNLPAVCFDHWRVLGEKPPKELVGVLGDLRRKAPGWLQGFASSRDGRYLATGGKAIHLLDPRDGSIQKSLAEAGFVLAISPDGKQLASATWPDQEIELWDIESGKLNARLQGHTGQLWCLAFTPDGQTLMSGSSDLTIRLWDMASRKYRQALPAHVTFGSVCCLAVSPDGDTLIATATEDTVRCYVLPSGHVHRTLRHQGVRAVAWSRQGEFIASSAIDGSVKIWDPLSGNEVSSFKGVNQDAVFLSFDPDSHFLAVGQTHAEKRGEPSEVRLFEVGSWQQVAVLPHEDQVGGLAFSPDGRVLFTCQWASSTVHLWDVNTGTDPQPLTGHFGEVLSVAFSPEDCRVVTSGADKTMRLWDVVEGKELRRFEGFRRGVMDTAISPDGRNVLSDDRFTRWGAGDADDNSLRLCDLTTGTEIRRFEGEPSGSNALTFSPDGILALSAGSSVWLWDVASGKSLHQLEEHSSNVYVDAVAFSPDGAQAISAGEDGIVRIWDVKSGRALRRFEGHVGAVWTVAFTPDGRRVVSSGADGNVRIWELGANGSTPPTILAHAGPAVAAIAADGKTLAAAGLDGQIVLWDLAAGSRLGEFKLSDRLRRIAFAPDGRHLATANDNGTVYVLRVKDLAARAKAD